MKRRDFLQQVAAATVGTSLFLEACRSKPDVPVRSFDNQSTIGHWLRNKPELPKTYLPNACDVLLVGSGISALSTAYHLQKNNYSGKVTLLEMCDHIGGNSFGGHNTISAFPWAAHYLPIPGLHLKELLSFLDEANIIREWQHDLPVYHEDYLCYDNHERLFIQGIWQQGLIPEHGVPENQKKEIKRFMQWVQNLRYAKDEDGKYVFDIPLKHSSQIHPLFKLAQTPASDWLKQEGFTSPYLLWYLDYCCADDFGGGLQNTSAWALLHYFASRKGQAYNAHYDDNLTWPEGNYFLVKKFQSLLQTPIQTNQMVLYVNKTTHGYDVFHIHTETQRWTKTSCRYLVLNTPFHVCKKLLPELDTAELNARFQSFPWIVANITLRKPNEKNGVELSWDNVQYGLQSLGFIHSSHQTLQTHQEQFVFTYYKALYSESASKERRKLEQRSETELAHDLLNELERIYPNCRERITDIVIRKIGHGMISPQSNYVFSNTWLRFQEAQQGLYFCHTDFCGMSIFEEAFYKGLETANHIQHG